MLEDSPLQRERGNHSAGNRSSGRRSAARRGMGGPVGTFSAPKDGGRAKADEDKQHKSKLLE